MTCHLWEIGIWAGRTGSLGCLFILKAENSFWRYGFLRLILQLPNEMPWREAGNQLKINAKYTQDK